MGSLSPDRQMKCRFGLVENVFPADGRYEVLVHGGTRVTCRNMDIGMQVPLKEGDSVVIADSPCGWIILARVPMPVAPNDDAQKSLSQILAKAEQDMKVEPQTGVANKPSFQGEQEHVPTFGDILMRSRVSDAMMGIFSDASVILKSAQILYVGLLSRFRAAVITAGRLIINVIPGFSLKIWDVPKKSMQTVGNEAQQQDETVKRLEMSFATNPPDSTKPASETDRDVTLFAGGLKEWDDFGYGQSALASGKKMTRGIQMKIRDFGMFESDHDVREMRVTYLKDQTQSPGLFQFRINSDEVVLSWGDQFMSLNKDGLFFKAKVIGFGGPWVMWDPAVVKTFTHDKSPSDQTPICEWFQGTAKSGPGIKFSKSVYFGGNGVFQKNAYFGSSEKAAVLETFLTDVYAKDLQKLMAHTHGFTPPTGPVLISPDLASLGVDIVKVNTDVFLKS